VFRFKSRLPSTVNLQVPASIFSAPGAAKYAQNSREFSGCIGVAGGANNACQRLARPEKHVHTLRITVTTVKQRIGERNGFPGIVPQTPCRLNSVLRKCSTDGGARDTMSRNSQLGR
jgi:hypothetical protein